MNRTMDFITFNCLRDMFVARPPHGPHDALIGMATASAIMHACNESRVDVQRAFVATRVITAAQFDAYSAGRTCPTASVAKRLDQVKPGAGEPALWPRQLLSILPMRPVTLSDLSGRFRDIFLPSSAMNRGGLRSGGFWTKQYAFNGAVEGIESVWRLLYRMRHAECFGMQEHFWEAYWDLIRSVPEFASHPAIYPHRELLFHIVSRLFSRCPGYPAPIYVDWDTVRSACEQRRKGLPAGGSPFLSVEVVAPRHGYVLAAEVVMPAHLHRGYVDEMLI